MGALRPRRPAHIEAMARAGAVVGEMHEVIRAAVGPGVTPVELDALARQVLAANGATSNFLGYHGYPAAICASVNDTVIHGIPGDRPLVDGDLLSIDCGAVVDGWHGDAAFTVGVGTLDDDSARLIEVADEALRVGIATLVPGARLGDYGAAVADVVEQAGFAVVPDYVGHGIGRAMHEPPDVPNIGRPGRGARLRSGVTLAVEPMVVAGSPNTRVAADGWSVVTCDGSRAAHVEHSVVVTDDGPRILTRRPSVT